MSVFNAGEHEQMNTNTTVKLGSSISQSGRLRDSAICPTWSCGSDTTQRRPLAPASPQASPPGFPSFPTTSWPWPAITGTLPTNWAREALVRSSRESGNIKRWPSRLSRKTNIWSMRTWSTGTRASCSASKRSAFLIVSALSLLSPSLLRVRRISTEV